MIDNPFLSETYQNIWMRYFQSGKVLVPSNFIDGPNFYKVPGLSLFINAGKNLTNGITYQFVDTPSLNRNRTYIIFDVPDFLVLNKVPTDFRLLRVKQYPGHLLYLRDYKSYQDFLSKRFNAKTRNKFRGYFNKLEKNHAIDYQVLGKQISEKEYSYAIESFKNLLERRFDDLKVENDILLKWSFYKDLIYKMLKEEKAILNLIIIDNNISAMSLAFLSKKSVIGAIKAFDISYKNYSLGVIELLKLIEWSITNGYEIFDFSKGNQDYKKRFASNTYTYENHIVYNTKRINSVFLAHFYKLIFTMKQFMRELNINSLYWKFLHKTRSH